MYKERELGNCMYCNDEAEIGARGIIRWAMLLVVFTCDAMILRLWHVYTQCMLCFRHGLIGSFGFL